MKKVLVLLTALLATVATSALADWFTASGIPVQRSTISSAEFRTEFAAIQSNISDKLPVYTGNANNWVVVNAGGTALSSITNAAAQTLLGVAIGTDVQAWDTQLDDIAALAVTDNNFIVADGANWALETPAQARTSLGLAIGTNVQAYDADLTTYAGITPSANIQTLLGAATYAAMRTQLALTIGTDVQAYDADLTTWAGVTPSANGQSLVSAANYAAMRTSLGLVIGTNVQAYDADLTTWAGVTPSANGQSLVSAANYAAMRTSLGLVIGTNVQAWTAVLDANTASYTTALNSKLGGIEALADVTDATNVAAAGAPIISSGAGAPASTPSAVGDIYVDTTADYSYVAACTTTSACWKQATGLGGGDLLAANNLSDVALASTARTNLGLAIGSNVQAYDADLTTWAGITPSANVQSLNAAATYAAMRTLLDLETGTDFYSLAGANAAFEGIDATILKDADIGGSVQAYDADLTTLAAILSTDSNFIVGSATGWVAESGATALTSLGAQPLDADLTALGGLAKTNSNVIVGNGSTWVVETGTTLQTSLGLAIGTNVQAYDADLAAIAVLAKDDSSFMVGNGTNWVAETGNTLRTSMGVGTGDSPQLTGINVGHASDSTITRAAAGEIELEGRPMIVHDNGAYTGGRIIVTATTPTDVTGMDSGDMKFVY